MTESEGKQDPLRRRTQRLEPARPILMSEPFPETLYTVRFLDDLSTRQYSSTLQVTSCSAIALSWDLIANETE